MKWKGKKKNLVEKIEKFSQSNLGITIRKLLIQDEYVYILYIKQLIDRNFITFGIIKPLMENTRKTRLHAEMIAEAIIYADNYILDDEEDQIIQYLLKGNCVIILPSDHKYISVNAFKSEKRSVETPELTYTLRGPRDSFTEDFDTNISLIRYRIKDPGLRVDTFEIGRRTMAKVGVVYIDDIANSTYINKIKGRLSKINIDGVVESGIVQKLLLNNVFDLFPQMGIIERSDMACGGILEGKVVIIVEGSNLALIAPKTFPEFLATGDDFYDNIYLSVFSKTIRIISLILSLTASSIYVTLVSFNTDIMPADYILAVAITRSTVPFNAFLEATAMELIAEVLREASIRLPKQIGPAIGIVGTVVIGQAAVQAGLVSPLMVITTSISVMASFVAPDYTIVNPVHILKFLMISITAAFGLYGFTMGLTFIVINLISTKSFDVPYFAPLAPFHFKDIRNYMLSDNTLAKKRARFLHTKDKTRQ